MIGPISDWDPHDGVEETDRVVGESDSWNLLVVLGVRLRATNFQRGHALAKEPVHLPARQPQLPIHPTGAKVADLDQPSSKRDPAWGSVTPPSTRGPVAPLRAAQRRAGYRRPASVAQS